MHDAMIKIVPQQFIVSVHKSSTNSVDKKKKKKNVHQSASAALHQYLAIVMPREETQRNKSSLCISGSVFAIHT
jgi:hypothetical protein